MKILIDTHYLIWLLVSPEKIPKEAKNILLSEENEIICSSVNFWEISLKLSIGKIELENISIDDLFTFSKKSNLQIINLSPLDSVTFHKLPTTEHKDPFDRMLIWQSINNDYYFLTEDKMIKKNYKEFGLRLALDFI